MAVSTLLQHVRKLTAESLLALSNPDDEVWFDVAEETIAVVEGDVDDEEEVECEDVLCIELGVSAPELRPAASRITVCFHFPAHELAFVEDRYQEALAQVWTSLTSMRLLASVDADLEEVWNEVAGGTETNG